MGVWYDFYYFGLVFWLSLSFYFMTSFWLKSFLKNISSSFHKSTLAIFSSVMKVKNCCSGNNKYFFSRGENYFNWGRKWTTRTWRHFPLVFFLWLLFSYFPFPSVFFLGLAVNAMPTPLYSSVRQCLQFKLHFERNFFTFKHSFSFGFFSCVCECFFFGQVG